MARPKGSKNKPSEKVTAICTMCGSEKKDIKKSFYKSYSILFKNNYDGRMCICKDCVIEYFDKKIMQYHNEQKALLEVCRKLDVYYDMDLFDSLKNKKKEEEVVITTYFTKINSLPQYRELTFEDSDNIYESNNVKIQIEEIDNKEAIKRWGRSYSLEDLNFLEEHYTEWVTHNDCDKLSVKKLVRMICEKELEIEKAKIEDKPTDKLEKSYLTLLDNSSLTPKTMSALNETDSTKIFGMWIKDIEQYRPAEYFEDKEIYKDYDGFLDYLQRFVYRPLKNLLTGSREFDKEFNVENKNTNEGD